MNITQEELEISLYEESLNYYVYSDLFCGINSTIRENGTQKKAYTMTGFFVLDPVHIYEYALSVEEGDRKLKESCLYECVQLKNPSKVNYKVYLGKYKTNDDFPDENSLNNILHELNQKEVSLYKTHNIDEILALWSEQFPLLLNKLNIEIDLPNIKSLFFKHLQETIDLTDKSDVSQIINQGKEKGKLFENLDANLESQIKNKNKKKI